MIGLVSEVDRYIYSNAGNSLGGFNATYAVGTTGIACHFVSLSPREREALRAVGGANAKVADHLIMFEHGTTLAIQDRLKFGSDYYEVLGISDPDEMSHHIEVQVARVQGLTK